VIVKKIDVPYTTVTLNGVFLKYLTGNGLYLSSNNTNFNLSSYDLYSNIRLVSSVNPPFYGTPVSKFTVIRDSEIVFDLPDDLPVGFYDIVYCNPAGYVLGTSFKDFKGITII
jgi:hypothetical protein